MPPIMVALFRRLAPLLAALLALAGPTGARAEQQDIAAAARGVVRIVLVATNGSEAYFVGHGSGFAVAPDKIVTKNGRASCRERVCQYVETSVVGGALKKNKKNTTNDDNE